MAGRSADGDVAFAPVDGPSDAPNPHRVGYINDIHTFQPALLPTLAHARLLSGLTELLGPDIDAWQVATVRSHRLERLEPKSAEVGPMESPQPLEATIT